MRLPQDITRSILAGHSLGFTCNPDGTVIQGFEREWSSTPYPPPGFLRWNILEIGNGDIYGYYWPIGKEEDAPLVCATEHDTWSLIPESSSLAACLRRQIILGADVEEISVAAEEFGVKIVNVPDCDETESVGSNVDEMNLEQDSESPHLLLVAARGAIEKRDLTTATLHLKLALSKLPEYSEAWALLSQIFFLQQDVSGFANASMNALTSPLCFGAKGRRKILGNLQTIGDAALPEMNDPLWNRRNDLTFAEGVKENNDYDVLEKLIEEYHQRGMSTRAIGLRVLCGELMGRETVSFKERCNWTWVAFRKHLRSDVERAGLHERLPAI